MKWHYNILQAFNKEYYHGIITPAMLSDEIFIKGEGYWLVNYNKQRWLLPTTIVNQLPIKILESETMPYRNKIYHTITDYQSVRIKPEKHFGFKQLVDDINLKHSNPTDFKFFKILALASLVGRLNFRVSSEAGFGKDSIFSMIGFLRNNVSIINPRTAPAVEYRLFNKVLVLNELSNLEASQRRLLQELLLLIGDYKNVYEKSSRATIDTNDTYDISKLSLVIFYNNLDYYESIGKEDYFFDRMFTKAVTDRYIPFKLDGQLDMNQFTQKYSDAEIQKELLNNEAYFIKYGRSIEWYSQNYVSELKKKNWTYDFERLDLKGRHKLLFIQVGDYLKLYADDEVEWAGLLGLAYKKYLDYLRMIDKTPVFLGDYEKKKAVEEDVR